MQDHLKKPMSQDVIRTPCDPTVLLCVCKGTTKDQPQRTMDEFSLEVGEHVGVGVDAIVFIVKFFDRVRQLQINCETCDGLITG
jgi:hypothetical protein